MESKLSECMREAEAFARNCVHDHAAGMIYAQMAQVWAVLELVEVTRQQLAVSRELLLMAQGGQR